MSSTSSERQSLTNPERILNEYRYIAQQGLALGETVFGKPLPLDTITIFTRSNGEFTTVSDCIRSLGAISRASHGPTLYIEPKDLIVAGFDISYLGVRKPDETRPERGYVDYPVENYAAYQAMLESSPNLAEITSGLGKPLIEVKHPSFDIRAYIVAAEHHG